MGEGRYTGNARGAQCARRGTFARREANGVRAAAGQDLSHVQRLPRQRLEHAAGLRCDGPGSVRRGGAPGIQRGAVLAGTGNDRSDPRQRRQTRVTARRRTHTGKLPQVGEQPAQHHVAFAREGQGQGLVAETASRDELENEEIHPVRAASPVRATRRDRKSSTRRSAMSTRVTLCRPRHAGTPFTSNTCARPSRSRTRSTPP